MSQSILKMEQIVKSFGAVNVLKGVDFDLAKGEVHALVGGNGAGKSTLMKIMTGVYTKDSGKIIIKGEEKEIKSTNDAKENGIAMIFQEMSLVPSLTIAENIFLGYELKKHGMRDAKIVLTTFALCEMPRWFALGNRGTLRLDDMTGEKS